MRALSVRVVAIALAALVLASSQASAAPTDPESVVEAFIAAQNASDVEAALALVADDVVFTGPGGTYCGKEHVRPILEHGAAEQRRIEEVGATRVEGETVTQVDRVTSDENRELGVESKEYVDTFVVRDGKIASITSVTISESTGDGGDALAGVRPDAASGGPRGTAGADCG